MAYRNYCPKYKPPQLILNMLDKVITIKGVNYHYRNNNGIIYAFNRLDNGEDFTILIDDFKDLLAKGEAIIN